MATWEPKITDPLKYLSNLLLMLRIAGELKHWNAEAGGELERNVECDPGLDKGKRTIIATFVGLLNTAAARADELDALDAFLEALQKQQASVGRAVGRC